jgi:hypothetical protein
MTIYALFFTPYLNFTFKILSQSTKNKTIEQFYPQYKLVKLAKIIASIFESNEQQIKTSRINASKEFHNKVEEYVQSALKTVLSRRAQHFQVKSNNYNKNSWP